MIEYDIGKVLRAGGGFLSMIRLARGEHTL